MTRFVLSLIAASLLLAGGAASAQAPSSVPSGGLLIPVQTGYGNMVRSDQGPNGGFHVNRMGYGNYTFGPDGGFGGYPAGSPQAQILQEQQRRKCAAVPEAC